MSVQEQVSLQYVFELGDYGLACKLAARLNLHDLSRMRKTSKVLGDATEAVAKHLDDEQRRKICNLTPFMTENSMTVFLEKGPTWQDVKHGPTWLNGFVDLIRSKRAKYTSQDESVLRNMHREIADSKKRVRKQEKKIEELEKKYAKMRREEGEQLAIYQRRVIQLTKAIEEKA